MTNWSLTVFTSRDSLFRSINPHIYRNDLHSKYENSLNSICCADYNWCIKKSLVSTSVLSEVLLWEGTREVMHPELQCLTWSDAQALTKRARYCVIVPICEVCVMSTKLFVLIQEGLFFSGSTYFYVFSNKVSLCVC
jgi:hypothetical protein